MASPTLPKPVALAPLARSAPEMRLALAGVPGRLGVDGIHWASRALGGRTAYGDLALSRTPDRASAALWRLVDAARPVASATLELRARGAREPYATYTFTCLTPRAFSTEAEHDELQLEVGATPSLTVDASAPRPEAPRAGGLTIDGLAGGAALARHAWHLSAGGPAGPFTVSRAVDAASPALLAAFAGGRRLARVEIALAHTTYVLTDATISSYALAGDESPLERIGFDAARIAAR